MITKEKLQEALEKQSWDSVAEMLADISEESVKKTKRKYTKKKKEKTIVPPVKRKPRIVVDEIEDTVESTIIPMSSRTRQITKIRRNNTFNDNNPTLETVVVKKGNKKIKVQENAYLPSSKAKAPRPKLRKFKIKCSQCRRDVIIDAIDYSMIKRTEQSYWKCNNCITGRGGRIFVEPV